MNKQEAIERIESRAFNIEDTDLVVGLSFTKNIINQINEPQKVVLPEFVGEWIGYKKAEGYTLYGTLMEAEADQTIKKWLSASRQEVLALAWIFGYEIEKEEEEDE